MKIRTFLTALAICALPLASDAAFGADPIQKQLPKQQTRQPILNQQIQQPFPSQTIRQPAPVQTIQQPTPNQTTQQPTPVQTIQQPPQSGANAGPSQGAPAIVLDVTRFSITPNAPNAGDNVQIRATIRNSGMGTVAAVPWGLGPQGALTMGTQTNVTPGSSFDIATMWNATGGQQRLQVYIDPSGNQIRNTSGNRMREIAVNVAVSSNVASSGDPMQNQPMQPPMQNQPMQNQPMQQQDQSMQNPLVQMIQQKLQQAMGGAGLGQGAPQGAFTPGADQMQQQNAGMAPGQSGPPVMLEITSFSITPAAPNVGDSVLVIATIKNTGTATVPSVPWSIIGLQGALTMGSQPDVPAGGNFDIVATSKATKEGGPYTLRVIIDPTGSFINAAPEANRSSNRDIFVKPAGSAPQQR